jgi:hypothetical protein
MSGDWPIAIIDCMERRCLSHENCKRRSR